MNRIKFPPKEVPVVFKGDVIVVGGGVSGVAAAVCAARKGANVVLIEKDGVLGGTASSALMCWLHRPLAFADGIVREVYDRLLRKGAVSIESGVISDPEYYKDVAFELIRESKVNLFLHNQFIGPIVESNTVKGVFACSKEGVSAFLATSLVDATGDADVSYRAGVPCQKGREEDGKMRPVSLLFCISGVDYRQFAKYIHENPNEFSKQKDRVVLDIDRSVVRVFGLFDTVRSAVAKGELDPSVHYVRFEGGNTHNGIAYLNTTRLYGIDGSSSKDLTKAEIGGRHQIQQLMGMLRKVPGLQGSALVYAAPRLGIRETRRIIGEYVLSESDIISGAEFQDTAVIGHQYALPGAPLHEPDGTEGSVGDTRERGTDLEYVVRYPIPWRCFIPQKIEGLLVAGRCISVTHTGDRYVRSMPDCMMGGQVTGTAAALCLQSSVFPRNLEFQKLKEALKAEGVRYDW